MLTENNKSLSSNIFNLFHFAADVPEDTKKTFFFSEQYFSNYFRPFSNQIKNLKKFFPCKVNFFRESINKKKTELYAERTLVFVPRKKSFQQKLFTRNDLHQ